MFFRFTARHAAGSPRLRRSSLVLGLLLAAGTAFAEGPSLETLDEGRELFFNAVPACAICHALNDAGATGAIGPALDEIQPDAARVEQALRTGIGQMPAYTSLSDEEIAALAAYVAKASGGEP